MRPGVGNNGLFPATHNQPPNHRKISRVDQTSQYAFIEDWLYLVPVLAVSGFGLAIAPSFALGLVVGMVHMLFWLLCLLAYLCFYGNKSIDSPTKDFKDMIDKNNIIVTLVIPVFEEFLFRGLLLSLSISILTGLFPAVAALPLLATGLNLAEGCSILGTAFLFGIGHASNSKGGYAPVIILTLFGIIMAVLAVKFGLAVAIAAHIANNTTALSILKIGTKCLGPAPESTPPSITDDSATPNAMIATVGPWSNLP